MRERLIPQGHRELAQAQLTTTDAVSDNAALIRAAVARIAAAEQFRDSPQLVAFLTFVVEETLAGRGEQIKGYSIAIEALGRDPSFDPQLDPIVRVQATRLRRALSGYYAAEGADDPVVIQLDKGGYTPSFVHREAQETAKPEPVPVANSLPAERPAADRRTPFWAGAAFAAILIAVALGLGLMLRQTEPSPAQDDFAVSAAAPRVGPPLPTVIVNEVGDTGLPPVTVTQVNASVRAIRAALARFDDVAIVRQRMSSGRAHAPSSASLSYELTVDVTPIVRGGVNLSFLLTEASTGDIVWSRSFEKVSPLDGSRQMEGVVREVASALGQPYGVIIVDAARRFQQLGDSSYSCIAASFNYWRSYLLDDFKAVRVCLRALEKSAPERADLQSALTGSFIEEYRIGVDLGEGDPRANALASATRALEIAPNSARAEQAMMWAQFIRGDYNSAMEAGRRALRSNPYDTDVIADIGARYMQLGDFERGRAMLDEATKLMVTRPDWVEFFYFLEALVRDDDLAVKRAGSAILSDAYVLGQIARGAAFRRSGQAEQARKTYQRLIALSPEMDSAPETVLGRYHFIDFVRQALVDEIRALAAL
jgi:tetratricopeptide (TPR) repeat protein